MRIIKPYGTTKTGIGSDDTRVRRIHPNSFRNEAKDVVAFANSHPKLVLAQWISMIDKIITKPMDGDAPSLHQYNLREAVGTAAWSIVQMNDLLDAPPKRMKRLEREWWSKIHPYGPETEPTGALDFRGRWFSTFSSESDPARIDGEAIAHALYAHLYEGERRLGENIRARSEGLITARSRSISANVLYDRHTGLTLHPPWSEDDVSAFASEPNVLNSVADAISKYRGQREARTRRAIGSVMRDHYARLFTNAEGQPLSIQDASKIHPGLFALHEAAKSRFRRILKAPQAHWRKKLPTTTAKLIDELEDDWRNRQVNDLIRLGKVVHYDATPLGNEDSPCHIFGNWSDDVSKSRFWFTDGQTAIKSDEAFVRVWRHVLSFASRSVTKWADPNTAIEQDILGARKREEAVNALSVDDFDRSATVLFGASSSKFATSNREYRQSVMQLALTGLSRLRNAAFHFGGLTQFIEALHSLGEGCDGAALDAVHSLHDEDLKALSERLATDLRSVQAEHYLKQDQMDALTRLLGGGKVYFDDLPRFQNVLRRGQAAYYWRKVDLRLPPPASAATLRDMATCCQHLALKLLYERPFGTWLSELPSDSLREYVERYTVRATNEARRISCDDKLIARAAGSIKILDRDSIFDLFAVLRKASATEARDAQKHRRNQRDLGKYLRDLELDLVAQAFQDFVEGSGLNWVFDLKESWRSDKPKSTIRHADAAEPDLEDWQGVLYFLLHLVPVDEVNKLSHQLSRSSIRNGEQAQTASKLLSVLSLYERSHDSKFKGLEGAQGRRTLVPLFENGDLAGAVLDKADTDAASGKGSVRRLREMLRFEPPLRIINAMAQVPITERQMEAHEVQNATIAAAQATRSRLHAKWVKDGHRLSDKEFASYAKCLSDIIAHRNASHHVHLTNHLDAYRLLVACLAKLIDYVGIWERDLYFTTLALLSRSSILPNDVFSTARSRLFLGRGQIVEALRQRDQSPNSDRIIAALNVLFGVDFKARADRRIETRNELAHFGVLQGSDGAICVTDLVNRTRELVSYDRKRANRVSVSIGKLFDRFGLTLTWQSQGGILSEPKIAAKEICHLGRADISEPSVGPEYVELVRTFV